MGQNAYQHFLKAIDLLHSFMDERFAIARQFARLSNGLGGDTRWLLVSQAARDRQAIRYPSYQFCDREAL